MQFKFYPRICSLTFITILSMGASYSIWGQTLSDIPGLSTKIGEIKGVEKKGGEVKGKEGKVSNPKGIPAKTGPGTSVPTTGNQPKYQYVGGDESLGGGYGLLPKLYGGQGTGEGLKQIQGSRLILIGREKVPGGGRSSLYLRERYGKGGADYSYVVVDQKGQKINQRRVFFLGGRGERLTKQQLNQFIRETRQKYIANVGGNLGYRDEDQIMRGNNRGGGLKQIQGSRLIPITSKKMPDGTTRSYYVRERYGKGGADYSYVIVDKKGQKITRQVHFITQRDKKLSSEELKQGIEWTRQSIAEGRPIYRETPGVNEDKGAGLKQIQGSRLILLGRKQRSGGVSRSYYLRERSGKEGYDYSYVVVDKKGQKTNRLVHFLGKTSNKLSKEQLNQFIKNTKQRIAEDQPVFPEEENMYKAGQKARPAFRKKAAPAQEEQPAAEQAAAAGEERVEGKVTWPGRKPQDRSIGATPVITNQIIQTPTAPKVLVVPPVVKPQ